MLTTHFAPAETRPAPLVLRAAATLYWAWYAYRARRAQRLTVQILQSLDQRTLKDIGVDQSEIESTVYNRSGDRLRLYDGKWC
jgi:uncharacterized protein YjiS (DUF1127 family)